MRTLSSSLCQLGQGVVLRCLSLSSYSPNWQYTILKSIELTEWVLWYFLTQSSICKTQIVLSIIFGLKIINSTPLCTLTVTRSLLLLTEKLFCRNAPRDSNQHIKSSQKNTDSNIVAISLVSILRYFRIMLPLPVIKVDPFAIQMGIGI